MTTIPGDNKTIVRSYTNNTYPETIISNIKAIFLRIIKTSRIITALRKRSGWDEETFHLID